MKKLFVLIILLIAFPIAAQAARVYAPQNAKLYEVGNNINPGTYSLEFDEKDRLNLAIITVGNDLKYTAGKDAILIKNGKYTEYKIDKNTRSIVLELVEGNKLFVNAGSPRLVPVNDPKSTGQEPNLVTSAPVQNKLSTEEVKRITNKAPYVSSKNITIDSPEGVDFYTYFGSGIIMSGISGDCFKMVDCDDEPIVDHYKLIPLKVGKGKIEYVINMRKKIVVNITVKEAAIIRSGSKETISPENASFACAIKTVNIRADVNTKSQKVGELKKGEKVEVIKAFYTKDFHQILYKGKTCYVAVKFVELK